MTEQEFVQFVKEECKYYGVKFRLSKSRQVRLGNGGMCRGFFDDGRRELVCATNNPHFLGILAHEYCHMRQWIEKADIWVKANELDSYTAWQDFLDGKEVDAELHLSIIRDLELDNEKRTVALIKKLKLPIDVGDYIKKANCYIMFYNWMKISGKWCKTAPYDHKRLFDAVPDKFSLNYNKLPKKLETIFREEGI